jgi:hypothetical protein
MAIGLHHLSSLATPEAPYHQLTDLGEIEVVLGGDAVETLLRMEGAEQLAAFGSAATGAGWSSRRWRCQGLAAMAVGGVGIAGGDAGCERI